jgi:hypothetical protein
MLPCLSYCALAATGLAEAAAVGSKRLLHSLTTSSLGARAAAAGQPTHFTHSEVSCRRYQQLHRPAVVVSIPIASLCWACKCWYHWPDSSWRREQIAVRGRQ